MMHKVKIGVRIVIAVAITYAIVSYTIFYVRKSSLDKQLSIENQIDQPQAGDVVVQSINNTDEASLSCSHVQDSGIENFIVPESQNESTNFSLQENIIPEPVSQDSYSFITMPAQDCVIDKELLYTFDLLLGQDLDEFVRLVLQSNNNIVSKQACRSCAMYGFFNKIKKHEQLTVEDIQTLQSILANLYRFVENMKKMSSSTMLLRPEQYEALKDLHRSQAAKNDKNLQARKAATAAALKRLQTLSYR
jgi:hypothetical protein